MPTLEERLNAERLKRLEKDQRKGIKRQWEWESEVEGWQGGKGKAGDESKHEAVVQG